MDAFRLILVSLAGWMNREQQLAIDYLQEEIRVLKEQEIHGPTAGAASPEGQGVENKSIEVDFRSDCEGRFQCRQRLGGMLRYYHRDAA